MSITSIPVFIPTSASPFGTVLHLPPDNYPDAVRFLKLIWTEASWCLKGVEFGHLSLRSLRHPIPVKPVETLRLRLEQTEANNGSEVPHTISLSWSDQEMLNVYVYIDRGEVVKAAESLKRALWGKSLHTVLRVTSDGNWEYVPREQIKSLGLDKINYREVGGLLIRPEYEAALKAVIIRRQEAMAIESNSGGAIVVGQPGIGKSVFLYYLLLHFLSEATPVAFEIGARFLVFQANGISVHSVDADGDCLPEGSWALSDSTSKNMQPCYAFLNAASMRRTWVVQATSPLVLRWKAWKKEYRAISFVMEPFSIDEMAALGEVFSLNPDDLRRNYEKWGPSARTCVLCSRLSDFEAEHETVVIAGAVQLVKNPEVTNLSGKPDEDPMAVPHNLFSVYPRNKTDLVGLGRSTPEAKIATPHIRKLISYEVAAAEARDRVRFFQTLSRQPILRSALGTLFERFVLCWLASGSGSLQCTPAIRTHKHPTSTHGSNDLKIPACAGKDRTFFLSSKTELTNKKVKHFPSCYLPGSQTFPTVDAIILTVDCLITVQVTMSNHHGAKKIGFDMIRETGIQKRNLTSRTKDRRWCHVFVTDEETKAKFLREQTFEELPEDISIYSAIFNVGRSDSSVENIQTFEAAFDEDIMDTNDG